MRMDIDHLTVSEPEAVLRLKAEVRRLQTVIAALADQDGTLSVQGGNEDPAAWLAFSTDGSESCNLFIDEAEAAAAAVAMVGNVVPLYFAFRLTDEERAAAEFFGAMSWPPKSQQIKARAATLRGLLERTA